MPFKFGLGQVVALLLAPFALLVLAVLYAVVVPLHGRPFIFASERMRGPNKSFHLYKIRTLHPPEPASEETVLCGTQARRVTPVGKFLRRTRLDELPQIFNVLKGDMRFVGPRPPLRRYVEAYPELYAEILKDTPPGITGLATVMVHRREERLLSLCNDPIEADRIYRTYCIPLKARLDLIYRDNRSFSLNALVLYRTLSRLPSLSHPSAWGRRSETRRTLSLATGIAPSTLPSDRREAA
ncbi:sugar transferase [Silicimonas sp. MF1-12-2]|uniref:sugar transferase n=1 Tax=Silicimonas sp. MF1-12-2 TaxID=3384793 RepID=UPI0039B46199